MTSWPYPTDEQRANEEALQQPTFDLVDALVGGVTGLPRGILAALSDALVDAGIGITADANEQSPYKLAGLIGLKGLKALGLDASKDLVGQFSSLVDRKVRKEIPDIHLKEFSPDDVWRNFKFEDLKDYAENPEVVDYILHAYPELKDVKITPVFGKNAEARLGSKQIDLGVGAELGENGRIVKRPDSTLSTQNLAHEIQHFYQDIEKFPRGGMPDIEFIGQQLMTLKQYDELDTINHVLGRKTLDPHNRKLLDKALARTQAYYDIIKETVHSQVLSTDDKLDILSKVTERYYQSLYGEREAEAVSSRVFMTPEQKMRTYPGDTTLSEDDYTTIMSWIDDLTGEP